MNWYIITLIISIALLGFHINLSGNNTLTGNVSKRLYSLEKNEDENIIKKLNVNVNEDGNEELNENGNENGNENTKIIFNEMGDELNVTSIMKTDKSIIDITTFKGEGLPSSKPTMNPSSRVIDSNGLIENFGSYKDNFPYESSYLKTIDSKNKIRSVKDIPINKFKEQSGVSKVILPEGIKEYVEDFDFFRKTIRLAKDTVKTRDKVLVTPHVKINNFKDRIINTLPDEIVFKTMPDNGELFEERNNVLVKDKNIIFYETKKLIDESKSIFNLKQ
jgi:hypothetical protein